MTAEKWEIIKSELSVNFVPPSLRFEDDKRHPNEDVKPVGEVVSKRAFEKLKKDLKVNDVIRPVFQEQSVLELEKLLFLEECANPRDVTEELQDILKIARRLKMERIRRPIKVFVSQKHPLVVNQQQKQPSSALKKKHRQNHRQNVLLQQLQHQRQKQQQQKHR